MAHLRWKNHLSEILKTLNQHPAGPLDREQVELLFRVGKRQANVLMHKFGAAAVATGPILIDRDRLMASLEEMARSGTPDPPDERRAALAQKLDTWGKQRATPFAGFTIPATSATYGARFDSLPASIRFEPGRLVIEHQGFRDLWGKIFLMGQIGLNDMNRIAEEVEASAHTLEAPSPQPAFLPEAKSGVGFH